LEHLLLLIEKTSRILSKLSQYTHLSVDVEPDNDILQNMQGQLQLLQKMAEIRNIIFP